VKRNPHAAIAQLSAPSEREAAEITAAKVRNVARRPRLTVRMVQGKHCAQIGPNHADAVGWTTRALDTLGTSSGDFVCKEIDRLGTALNVGMKADQGAINAALAVLDGQRPRDEIEAQLLIQMVATHAYAMDLMGRSKRSQLLDHLEAFGKLANRLLRTYAMQCDTLTALRRGGKQIVEVQHVYRDRRKPEGVAEKRQPQPRGPNGRWQAAYAEEKPANSDVQGAL
jgi:hypothetical protein